MSIVGHDQSADGGDSTGAAPVAEGTRTADEMLFAPQDARAPFEVPLWLREFGMASWLLLGLAIVVLALCAFVAALRMLLLPMLFAALLGATFMPLADRLELLANSARSLPGYIWGSTIIGWFNRAVMFMGALVLGVPQAATIGIVGWFTNYVPMFGAIIGGPFAVLIDLGAGGLPTALGMLVVVVIANGALQTVVSQFALGATLKLHPLAVLFATTAGTIFFGAIGGIVMAPFLKIAIDAFARLKAVGLFGTPQRPPGDGSADDAAPGAEPRGGPLGEPGVETTAG